MRFKSSFTTPAVAAISFCLIGGTVPASAYADLGDQLFKLLAKDGAVGDNFGFSVRISDTQLEFSNLYTSEFTRPEGVPDPMAVAAIAFLASLDDAQRVACRFEFEHAERRHWQPVPMGDAGVRLDEMTESQRTRARALLQSVLSARGLATIDGVMVLERILVAMAADRGQRGGLLEVDRYFFTIYGDPERESPWGWRVEGHHLSMTFTCKNGEWTAHGPLFVGSQPARVKGGEHDGMRLLGSKDDNVRDLLASFDDEQCAKAVVKGALPRNIILLPGRNDGFDEPLGLAVREMTPAQRQALFLAISDWASWLRVDLAKAEIESMQAGLDKTRVLWMGGTGVDEPHYWRIVGPHFAIEYAAPARDPDHVHALWRNTENDFGGELLRRHLAEHHSGGDH
ncbi:MAG: DUF3500 domain-containing protein [Phycisphaerales bacterium]